MVATQPLNDASDVNMKSIGGWSMVLKEMFKFVSNQLSTYPAFDEIRIFASKLSLDSLSGSTLSFTSAL